MMKASSGPLAFRGIARGTVVIEHPGKPHQPERRWNRLRHPRRAIAAQWLRSTSHCMPAESISPRANAGAASLTNQRIRSRSSIFLFLHVAESCFSRASTAPCLRPALSRLHARRVRKCPLCRSPRQVLSLWAALSRLGQLGPQSSPADNHLHSRLGSLNEREHLLNLGNALDYARDGNDFADIIVEFRGE